MPEDLAINGQVGPTLFSGERISDRYNVLGVPIEAATMGSAIRQVSSWLETAGSPRMITFTNVHMVTEANRNPNLMHKLCRMDMNCPDGMPLVWLGKSRGCAVGRVCGPEFMTEFCTAEANNNYRHFFYGGGPGVAELVIQKLRERNPGIQVAGYYTPPFRNLTPEEDAQMVEQINSSGADIVWVCLGCPRQELWMAEHRDRLNVKLLLAVGMAFDVIAGKKKRAPSYLRANGLEWVYRLASEPQRLAGRYLVSNFMFFRLLFQEIFFGRATQVR